MDPETPAPPAPPAHPPEAPPGGRPLDTPRLVWGVVLVVVGGLLLLDRLDFFWLHRLGHLWPLVLVAVGVATLASARDRKGQRSGLWLLLLGLWLQINVLELFGLDWDETWPLLIIAAGAVELLVPKRPRERWSALWPIAIGLWLLVTTLHVGGLDWEDSWPLLLILIGALIITKAFVEDRRPAAGGAAGEGEEG